LELSNTRRVVFRAADGEKVVIKGSEAVSGWEPVEATAAGRPSTVWKKTLDNAFFGSCNPFAENIVGEWVVHGHEKHLGDVYLNGRSFYEVTKYEDLAAPPLRTEVLDDWTTKSTPIINPEQTQYVWYDKSMTKLPPSLLISRNTTPMKSWWKSMCAARSFTLQSPVLTM
ncbi:hypothetical protein ACYULU_07090, partial [Breznakiellaceae bacterium SP9]